MKTIKKHTSPDKTTKTGNIVAPDIFLEQEEGRQLAEGDLTEEDFEALGSVNLANDLGDDEQIKYWEDLGKNSPTSEMEDYELNVDYELQVDDDDE
jgi:hypothetical protein